MSLIGELSAPFEFLIRLTSAPDRLLELIVSGLHFIVVVFILIPALIGAIVVAPIVGVISARLAVKYIPLAQLSPWRVALLAGFGSGLSVFGLFTIVFWVFAADDGIYVLAEMTTALAIMAVPSVPVGLFTGWLSARRRIPFGRKVDVAPEGPQIRA